MLLNTDGFVYLDGASGTMLQKRGLKHGERSDIMNVTNPDAVLEVAGLYVAAGSDIICTNTFGANAVALKKTGYTPREIISKAVALAKQACGGKARAALDIGPIGEYIDPLGDMDFDGAYDIFKEQAIAGAEAGADLAIIETMSDLMELKAAICAIRDNTSLDIIALMTFDKTERTFAGCLPESFAVTAQRLGASAVGINCSLQPSQMTGTARRIASMTSLPLVIKPNAGLPDSTTGDYAVTPEEFARQMTEFVPLGVRVAGGCCGTAPEHIAALRSTFAALKPQEFKHDDSEYICSPYHFVKADSINTAEQGASTVDGIAAQAEGSAPVISLTLPDGMTAQDAQKLIAAARETSREKPLHITTGNAEALSGALRHVCGIAAVTLTRKDSELEYAAARYGAVIMKGVAV